MDFYTILGQKYGLSSKTCGVSGGSVGPTRMAPKHQSHMWLARFTDDRHRETGREGALRC